MIYVLYHDNCFDGFTAAWVAWRKFGDAAKYIPVNYGAPAPDLFGVAVEDNEIYILDFCFPKEQLEGWQHCANVTVLDHHKTAQPILREALIHNWVYDERRSGAGIAWDYFFPGEKRPKLVDYVEDRDLWRWALPASRNVDACIRLSSKTFDHWNSLEVEIEESFHEVVRDGAVVLATEKQMIETMLQQVTKRTIMNSPKWQYIDIPTVNATVLYSDVADEMLKRYPDAPFVFYYYDRGDYARHWGLRSRVGSDVDVSVIAAAYGGGGHKHAAGYVEIKENYN